MRKANTVKQAPKSSGGLFTLIGDVKSELQKISWTNKEELQAYTKMVVIATFLCAFGIYLVDLGIQGMLGLVNLIFLGISG
ncbi:MAG: preprotein translocase subunit SecE [Waddliaceae bacterium]|nr:preprotein translocase subunit SecE [Waddliaceae bacterium]